MVTLAEFCVNRQGACRVPTLNSMRKKKTMSESEKKGIFDKTLYTSIWLCIVTASGCCDRICCKGFRSFELHVYDNHSQVCVFQNIFWNFLCETYMNCSYNIWMNSGNHHDASTARVRVLRIGRWVLPSSVDSRESPRERHRHHFVPVRPPRAPAKFNYIDRYLKF